MRIVPWVLLTWEFPHQGSVTLYQTRLCMICFKKLINTLPRQPGPLSKLSEPNSPYYVADVDAELNKHPAQLYSARLSS